jgi:hypothetical protein
MTPAELLKLAADNGLTVKVGGVNQAAFGIPIGEPSKTLKRKYHNVPCLFEGIMFDSGKEAERYRTLKLHELVGAITDLKRQVKFEFVINGVKVTTFTADFTYREPDYVVEDVKSEITRREPRYRIKKKLMLAVHGITIRET